MRNVKNLKKEKIKAYILVYGFCIALIILGIVYGPQIKQSTTKLELSVDGNGKVWLVNVYKQKQYPFYNDDGDQVEVTDYAYKRLQ